MITIRHLRLRAITSARIYAADIPLRSGLNVVQADNTSGKSTSLQAIIYALGLERSLGPQLAIPLPYAMRERIHRHKDEPLENVLQSFVELEIENDQNQTLIIHRDVTGGRDPKLVQTWAKGTITGSSDRGQQRDFYVHDGGAAQRDDGFHGFLAEFMGWNLPLVPRFDGTESILYLEAIFPMLFVEQKRGWSVTQGPFPTYLRIQDVARRVMEFLLDLDAGKIRRERGELRSAIANVVQRWTERRSILEEHAQRVGRLRGIPAQPSAEFALAPELRLEIYRQDDWQPLSQAATEISARIRQLEAEQLQPTEKIAPELQQRLELVRREVDELGAVLEIIRNDFNIEQQEEHGLRTRLASLNSDLLRNQDALKLKRLGSSLGRAASEHVCPICHQDVSSELLPAVENVGMGLEENIAFVRSQIDLYGTAVQGATGRVNDCRGRHRSMDEQLKEKQAELRSLRQALVQPSSAPSRVTIEEIVRLQAQLDRIVSLEEVASVASQELQQLAQEWSQLQDRLRRLASDELTDLDKRKIDRLQNSIQRQLAEYGFRSFKPNEIILSRDNFRPLALSRGEDGELVEKELGYEISASDGIRLKWAYYLSLLFLSEVEKTNHAGMVIFDEPGQQEIAQSSLNAFLRDAAQYARGRQVIISSSETLDSIRSAVGSVAHIVSFVGFILQPLDASSTEHIG